MRLLKHRKKSEPRKSSRTVEGIQAELSLDIDHLAEGFEAMLHRCHGPLSDPSGGGFFMGELVHTSVHTGAY